MKILIIGASFAGVYCSLQARKLYPEAEITIIEKNEVAGFLPNGLLLYLQGNYERLEDATFISNKQLQENNIQLHLNETFLTADAQNKQLITDKATYIYDKLVLATGSTQHSTRIELVEEEIFHYKTYQAAKFLLPKIEQAQEITIIGAGQAGLEAASVFVELGKQVHVFETLDYPLFKYFDQAFLAPFVSAIEQLPNLTMHFNQQISKIVKNEQFEVNAQQTEWKSDLILTTVNVHPTNVAIEEVQIHKDQTIHTDAYLETSQKDIFAIGDLIKVPLKITNEKMYLPQISNAVRTGIVAASNLAEPMTPFEGGLRMIGTKLFGWYLASVGLLEAEAFIYPQKIATKTVNIPVSFVSKQSMQCKFIFEEQSHRLLGVQLLAKENCLDLINRCGWAIEEGLTLEELMMRDFFFHAQFSNHLASITELLGSDDQ